MDQKNKLPLNGLDCLMLAFDHQLKKNGYAGNQSQIILGLDTRIEIEALRKRLTGLAFQFPLVNASLRTSFWKGRPYWLLPVTETSAFPEVRTHFIEDLPGASSHEILRRQLLNTPLNVRHGELLRLDLIYFQDRRMEIIMTWHHILMDARGAEYFLHMIGNCSVGSALSLSETVDDTLSPLRKRMASIDMKEKLRLAEPAFGWIDRMALLRPVSLYTKLKSLPAPKLDFRIDVFSLPETEAIMKRSRSTCGVMNSSAYFLSATLLTLAELYQQKGIETRSYIVSSTIDLRKIGTRLPIFTNQAGVLLYEFKSEDLLDYSSVANLFRLQTQEALRNDMLFSNLCTMELSRFMPSWLYVRKIKKALRGEIASLLFANPGVTFQGLSTFMDEPVQYQYHVPAVVTPPGIGIVYYFFSGRLQITLAYAEGLLSREEATGFLADVRRRLLAGK